MQSGLECFLFFWCFFFSILLFSRLLRLAKMWSDCVWVPFSSVKDNCLRQDTEFMISSEKCMYSVVLLHLFIGEVKVEIYMFTAMINFLLNDLFKFHINFLPKSFPCKFCCLLYTVSKKILFCHMCLIIQVERIAWYLQGRKNKCLLTRELFVCVILNVVFFFLLL